MLVTSLSEQGWPAEEDVIIHMYIQWDIFFKGENVQNFRISVEFCGENFMDCWSKFYQIFVEKTRPLENLLGFLRTYFTFFTCSK